MQGGRGVEESRQVARSDCWISRAGSERRELLTGERRAEESSKYGIREVAKRKKNGEDADDLIVEMREVAIGLKSLDDEVRELGSARLTELTLAIPNIPHESVYRLGI